MSNNYALSTTYGTLAAGNQPLSDFDGTNCQLAAMGTLMCTASGTNTVTLTSVVGYPTMTAYGGNQKVGFLASATSTSLVMIGYSALSVLNAYEQDGVTQIGANGIVNGFYYEFAYNSSLNSSAGGWQQISGAGSQLLGTKTNDNANAGNVGEFKSASVTSVSAVSLTSLVGSSITNVSLTAGDWDVWGIIQYTSSASITSLSAEISSSANSVTANQLQLPFFGMSVVSPCTIPLATLRVSVASPTTYYLNALGNFSGTVSSYGSIFARRAR